MALLLCRFFPQDWTGLVVNAFAGKRCAGHHRNRKFMARRQACRSGRCRLRCRQPGLGRVLRIHWARIGAGHDIHRPQQRGLKVGAEKDIARRDAMSTSAVPMQSGPGPSIWMGMYQWIRAASTIRCQRNRTGCRYRSYGLSSIASNLSSAYRSDEIASLRSSRSHGIVSASNS